MAAGRLPAPGTELGPCAEPCIHRDCAETRRMAETVCRWCGRTIGYEVRFYIESESRRLVHADCAEDAEIPR